MAVPRVLIVVPALFRREGGVIGGAERYAVELARHMADATPTELLTFGPADDEWTDGRLRVRVRKPWRYVRHQPLNPFYPGLWRDIRRADVVHFVQKHVVNASYGAMVCRLMGRKAFVTDLGGGGWDLSAYVDTDRWFRADIHISAYAKSLQRSARVAREPVVFAGVDTRVFSPPPSPRGRHANDDPDEAAEVSDAPARDHFLVVARLLPHKGADLVVEALAPGMRLVLVGEPYDPQYTEDLRLLARGKDATILHGVDDTALVDLYRRARAVLLTSRYRDRYGRETAIPDLLGQSQLEGMACGAPAIVTNVGGLPETVRDGVDGFVVEPTVEAVGAAMRTLWDDPAKAHAMGRAACAHVAADFSWNAVVGRCLRAYESF